LLYFGDIEDFEKLPTEIQKHLLKNKKNLENRADKIRRKTAKWWNYTFPMHKELYHLDKIFCSYRAKENAFCFDDAQEYIGLTNTTVIFDTNSELHLKYVLALLNSKLLNFRYKSIAKQTGGGVFEYVPNAVEKLPIPLISKDKQEKLIEKVNIMLEKNKEKQAIVEKFIKRIRSNLKLQKLTKKIENFYLYDFYTFNQKLKKQKIKLNFQEQDSWEEYFDASKNKIYELLWLINETNQAIDKMVYELYKLTEEEIKIVEDGGEC